MGSKKAPGFLSEYSASVDMRGDEFDPAKADKLEDPERYRYVSRDELAGALRLQKRHGLLEIGSGTGFYTDALAPHVRRIVGIDSQKAMHDYYRKKGVPANVVLLTAEAEDMPFETREFDAAFSTMTFHEFASTKALKQVKTALKPGSRFVIADWSVEGRGDDGPDFSERYSASEARKKLDNAGFTVHRSEERIETFFLVAQRPK